VTNEVPVALAPRIDAITPDPVVRDAAGTATLTVTFTPQVRSGQRTALLVGERYVNPQAPNGPPAPAGTLDFVVPQLPAGGHVVRLRVDGVDSVAVDRAARPPRFDPSQQVTVQ
jgi:hypothetical protein